MSIGMRALGRSKANTPHATGQARAQTSGGHDGEEEPVDDKPRSVYELVTRQMLEQVKADVNEVKGRVNTLLWLVIGAMLLELVMRVLK